MANTDWFARNGYSVLWIAHWTSASQPTVPGGRLGWRRLDVLAALEHGHGPGHQRPRRPRPVQRPVIAGVAPGALTALVMTGPRQVLFIQGGGEGTHDEWDDKLVDSLRRELGDGLRGPLPADAGRGRPERRGVGSGDPARRWRTLDDGAVVVGHSVGGTLLVHALAEQPPDVQLGAIVLIATPVRRRWRMARRRVRAVGRPRREAARTACPVHLFHGLDDDTAPPAHAELYAGAIPQAAAAPAARARSPAGQRPGRGGARDPGPSTASSPAGRLTVDVPREGAMP